VAAGPVTEIRALRERPRRPCQFAGGEQHVIEVGAGQARAWEEKRRRGTLLSGIRYSKFMTLALCPPTLTPLLETNIQITICLYDIKM